MEMKMEMKITQSFSWSLMWLTKKYSTLHVHVGHSKFGGLTVFRVDRSKYEKENCRRGQNTAVITRVPGAMLSLNQEKVHQ